MFKQFLDLKKYLLPTCLIFLFVSTSSYAEIFKWVDENGKTHYSDKKPDEDKLKVEELKIKSSPKIIPKDASAIPSWKQKELELQQEQEQKHPEKQKRSAVVKKHVKGWGSDEPETDATRCALARDIIKGTAILANGREVDAHSKKLARDEVRKFCH